MPTVLFVYRFVYVMLNCPLVIFKILALAGNRTPVSRVAGENSTIEPPMLTVENTQDFEQVFLSIGTFLSLRPYLPLLVCPSWVVIKRLAG